MCRQITEVDLRRTMNHPDQELGKTIPSRRNKCKRPEKTKQNTSQISQVLAIHEKEFRFYSKSKRKMSNGFKGESDII